MISEDAEVFREVASETMEALNSRIGVVKPLGFLTPSEKGRRELEQNLDEICTESHRGRKWEEDCLSKMQDKLVQVFILTE